MTETIIREPSPITVSELMVTPGYEDVVSDGHPAKDGAVIAYQHSLAYFHTCVDDDMRAEDASFADSDHILFQNQILLYRLHRLRHSTNDAELAEGHAGHS